MLKGQNKSIKCAKIRDIWNNPRELWLFREAVISVLVTVRVFSDTWGFPTWSTDALFLFPSCQKNLDYVRILRRNNWIVRSQKFRISDGWVQNLTTVPGKDGSVQNKTNRSEFGHIHLIFDTFVQYSDSVVPFRTMPSNFGLYRFVWDNSQISCSTVPF